jgi:hypothetical protein
LFALRAAFALNLTTHELSVAAAAAANNVETPGL